MARGNWRVDDRECLYCGHTINGRTEKMPYKIGVGANKRFLCEKCFNKTTSSKEEDISKYRNR
ncbi:MAG: hypothetical protein ACRDD7_16905 [Peptostreptococcaceae bacterium]